MRKLTSLIALCLAGLSACGGGSGSGSSSTTVSPPVSIQSPPPPVAYSGIGGYYTFSDSSQGSYGHIVVAPDGSFVYDISVGGCYSLAHGKFALGSDGYTIMDSNSYLSGQGQCAGSSTLSVSGDFIVADEIDMYGQDGSQVEWHYVADVSTLDASLGQLAGQYQFAGGEVMTVKDDGTLTVSSFGCAVSGKVSVPDATLNVYVLTATFSHCSADEASLEGVVAQGVFTLDYNDDQIVGGIHGFVNGREVTLFGSAQLL